MKIAVVAYKSSLKKYINEMKDYVTSNPLTNKNQQHNQYFIDKTFICKVFEKLETEITEDTEILSLKMKKTIREKFDENMKKKIRELYEGAVKEIINKNSKYKNNNDI